MFPQYSPDPESDAEQPAVQDAPVEPATSEVDQPRYRAANNDSTFGYLIAVALAVGLTPLLPAYADMRYTLIWGVMAGFGVLAWLLGGMTRIEQETLEDLAWGIVFGLIIALPLLLIGGSTLATSVELLFRADIDGAIRPLPSGMVLAYVVFVMPLAETLFFRGVLQETRPFWVVAILSTLWSLVLFGPMLDLTRYPGVAILVAIVLILMNVMYSYVRNRNGLAAAWLCQIIVNIVLLFLPYFSA